MKAIGWILVALATFMLFGAMRAGVSGPVGIAALVITVVLPGAAGIALISGLVGTLGRGRARDALRRQTLEAELLRLARRHAGRLTLVEVVGELAVSHDEAKDALDALAVRGLADFEVTDSGVVVYVFHDVKHIEDKHDSRGLLE
jgi:hypothetical protein